MPAKLISPVFLYKKMYEKIPLKRLLRNKYSYIICFRSYYILKKNLINRAIHAAINVHPSPPKYRGPGGVNYALYKNEKFFGSTCYIINEKIDNGKILDVKKIKIVKNETVNTLLKKTYTMSLKQAKKLFGLLFKNKKNINSMLKKNKKLKWSKKINRLKDLDKFYKIDVRSTKKQLENKLRATNTKNFKPFIMLHNRKFYYKDN